MAFMLTSEGATLLGSRHGDPGCRAAIREEVDRMVFKKM